MPEPCALCDCDETEHTPRFINPAMPCQVRVCITPPTSLLPEGTYEDCGCPGYEPDTDDEEQDNP